MHNNIWWLAVRYLYKNVVNCSQNNDRSCGSHSRQLGKRVNVLRSFSVVFGSIVFGNLCGVWQASAQEPKPVTAVSELRRVPLSPNDSLKMLEIQDGFQVRLIANEPQVIDPVDVAFDDRGRMWVVEMNDYPYREKSDDIPRGRVRILTDGNGDGVYEHASTFADKLDMPTGVAFWKEGVLVTLAGRLVWMRDTNGDGAADQEEVWLSGFTQDNEQLRANHPRLGPDGWWYIACGLRGGKLVVGPSSNDSTPVFDIGSRDVRYNPRTKVVEPITGPAQFGLCWDDIGTRMFCSNRNPCTQVLFEQIDLTANPLAGIIPSTRDVIPSGEASRVFAIAPSWTTSNLHAGQFTAACGVFFSPQATLTSEVRGDVLACEPTGSLVHRRSVTHDGTTWSPPDELAGKEWLASRDEWFRPVNVVAAPGGGLVVVDMHRAVIEHPRWVPDELKNRPDMRWGNSAGRLYWTEVSGKTWPSQTIRDLIKQPLFQRPSAQLAALVGSDDHWMRLTASRILIEREATDVVGVLQSLVSNAAITSSARATALSLVAHLAPTGKTAISQALGDANRLVKVSALRSLGSSQDLSVDSNDKILSMAESTRDPWIRVESVLCLARGQANSTTKLSSSQVERLAKLAGAQPQDADLLIAVAAASHHELVNFTVSWLSSLESAAEQIPAHLSVAAKKLTEAILRDQPARWESVQKVTQMNLVSTASPLKQSAALAALVQWSATNRRSRGSDKLGDSVWQRIGELIQSQRSGTEARAAAIELLGYSTRPEDVALLGNLARGNEGMPMRIKALRAWAETGAAECDRHLIDQLASSGPQLQPVMFDLILGRQSRLVALLGKLDEGQIQPRQIGAVQLAKLVERADEQSKAGYRKHLDTIANSNRASVLKDYEACLKLVGNPTRGKEIFSRHCAACHRIDNLGSQVGPDISDSRTQTPDKLLLSIIDPNRAIDNNYFRYVVLTDDGRTVEGMISEETSDSIVIRGQNDQRTVVRRDSIEQLKATGVSLMPEGIESQVDQQAMADLLAFIKGWRYMSGAIPLDSRINGNN